MTALHPAPLTPPDLPPLERLVGAAPGRVLERLPRMGRVMVIAKTGGATHERIGVVQAVTPEAGRLRLSGACHAATIDPAPVAQILIDRRSVMQGNAYPRLTFLDNSGAVIAAVVSMEGGAPMEAALTGFARLAVVPEPSDPPTAASETPAEQDAGFVLLSALAESALPVTIAVDQTGFTQSWQGRIETVRPAMGFINVMTPDFHLHLRAGAVAGWQIVEGRHIALNALGQPTGLTITPEAGA
ncbi:hypothetical protein [Pseudotabrizicola sp. 4114]|uniref:hypothetical protein n=1 Tax=Pseudotabrizicola sp. 4114 TaxID=2817731 RepID=UPI002860CF94|nr:hypothetical protein [Pseudorhodobacter sp. 4114]